jgi:hypothetical protein
VLLWSDTDTYLSNINTNASAISKLVANWISSNASMNGLSQSGNKLENISRLMDKERSWQDVGIRPKAVVVKDREIKKHLLDMSQKVVWYCFFKLTYVVVILQTATGERKITDCECEESNQHRFCKYGM